MSRGSRQSKQTRWKFIRNRREAASNYAGSRAAVRAPVQIARNNSRTCLRATYNCAMEIEKLFRGLVRRHVQRFSMRGTSATRHALRSFVPIDLCRSSIFPDVARTVNYRDLPGTATFSFEPANARHLHENREQKRTGRGSYRCRF